MSAAGGALGVVLGSWCLSLLGSLGLEDFPRGHEIAMDRTIVFFAFGLSVLVGVVVGLLPVVNAARANMNAVMRDEGRTGTSGRGTRLLRRTLVTTQVAFALVLLIGAGLLLASFRQLMLVNPGFNPDNVLTAQVSPPASRYAEDSQLQLFTFRTLERVRAVPGVVSAAVTGSLPFGDNYSDSVIFPEGYAPRPGESLISPSRDFRHRRLLRDDGHPAAPRAVHRVV